MKRYLALFLLPLAVAGCDAMSAHTGVVARAGQHELTVDEAVELLAGNPRIPASREVVGSVADLWVDYTILAQLMDGDTALAEVDVGPVVRQYVQQRTFAELRDQVITQDTVISDAELRQLFQEQAPGSRIRARHILLSFPENATPAQQDSVRALAEDLRQRAESGEDFAALAEQYSEDTASARQGGDLGWFERGRMVKPFEDAAFALQPGEVSDVVQSPFGLHIIKVEERETPSFDEQSAQFRQQAVQQRRQESLNQYVDSLVAPANVQVETGARDVARNLARDPSTQLSDRAGQRELVTWDDGTLTAREFLEFVHQLPPQQRAQFASAPEDQLDAILKDIATNELVLADAEARGIAVPQAARDSAADMIRQQLRQAAVQSGLTGAAQDTAANEEGSAVEQRVQSYLEAILAGRQNLLPLGGLSFVLRQEVDWNIFEATFAEVVEQLEQQRQETGQTPTPTPPLPGQPGNQSGGPDTVAIPADTAA